MKILQLGKAYPPANLGGVEVVIQLLNEGLNDAGISCDVLGVNDVPIYIKEKYNVYKLFIDNSGVVWYTIYRVKGEEQKKTLTNKIFKVATLQQKGKYHEN